MLKCFAGGAECTSSGIAGSSCAFFSSANGNSGTKENFGLRRVGVELCTGEMLAGDASDMGDEPLGDCSVNGGMSGAVDCRPGSAGPAVADLD